MTTFNPFDPNMDPITAGLGTIVKLSNYETLKVEHEKLKEQLAEARKVLFYYGDGDEWDWGIKARVFLEKWK